MNNIFFRLIKQSLFDSLTATLPLSHQTYPICSGGSEQERARSYQLFGFSAARICKGSAKRTTSIVLDFQIIRGLIRSNLPVEKCLIKFHFLKLLLFGSFVEIHFHNYTPPL